MPNPTSPVTLDAQALEDLELNRQSSEIPTEGAFASGELSPSSQAGSIRGRSAQDFLRASGKAPGHRMRGLSASFDGALEDVTRATAAPLLTQSLKASEGSLLSPAGTRVGRVDSAEAETLTPSRVESHRPTSARDTLEVPVLPSPSSPMTTALLPPMSPNSEGRGGESPQLSPSRKMTSFARTLAITTASAAERLAEKLIERLQQCCLESAGHGSCSYVWDAQLPSGRRFSDAVARAFASQLKGLGFLRLEWWSGKEWKDMPGRYLIIHDTMYDKYNIRIRVHWSPESSQKLLENASANQAGPNRGYSRQTSENIAMVLIQKALDLSQQLVRETVASEDALRFRLKLAEERAATAERQLAERAVSAEVVEADTEEPQVESRAALRDPLGLFGS